MKYIILSILMIFTSLISGQNEKQELELLLIEQQLIEKKIEILKTKLKIKDSIIENNEIDLNMVEILIDQEALYIEKLISGNYLESYTNMLKNMKDSPNAKKLEATLIRKIQEFKSQMKSEIQNMPIGNNN